MVEVGFDKQKRVFYRVDHKKVDRKVEFVLQKEGGRTPFAGGAYLTTQGRWKIRRGSL